MNKGDIMDTKSTNQNDEPVRHAHCSFCGGKGPDMQAEKVVSAIGTVYRIPLSHTACKESALSLSLLGFPTLQPKSE
jgi:hypothetical protein